MCCPLCRRDEREARMLGPWFDLQVRHERGDSVHWQFTPYVLPVIVSALMSAALAIFILRRRAAPGAVLFCFLTLAVAEWSLGYALELASADLSTALFWSNIAWFGSAVAPTLWRAFVLQYTGRARWLTGRTMAMLTIEPFVTLLLICVNGFRS